MSKRLSLLVLGILVAATLAVPGTGHAADPYCNLGSLTAPNCYVAVDDGTIMALSVRVPQHCLIGAGLSTCPTIFEMSGYDGGSAEDVTLSGEYLGDGAPLAGDSTQLTKFYRDAGYAIVHASVRGTGCSGGQFDLFSQRSARDGYDLVEWIARQGWSNKQVGIMGHSYSGLTGFMVAAQQPPHLVAMTVSGLIDDLYRGITFMGGVSNLGFPLLWTGAIRPFYDLGGAQMPGLIRPFTHADGHPEAAQQCLANIATHSRTVLDDPIVQGAVNDTDSNWWQSRAEMNLAHLINVPTWISGAYQDEQTGPRGPTHLWEMVQGVPKRLVLSNGDHGTNQDGFNFADRLTWMDHWMGRAEGGYGTLAEKKTSTRVLLELHGGQTDDGNINDTSFPLSTTQWTPYYLGSGGTMTTTPPSDAGTDQYISGTQRQAWTFGEAGFGNPQTGSPVTTADGPDEATYSYGIPSSGAPVTIAGPITANVFLSSATPDTEMFVELIDQAPDGARTYLQRGMLKASHRAIDPLHSDCVDATNVKVSCTEPTSAYLYRPHRPHTNPQLINPGDVNEYLIEIFPVGHVFRPGHSIMVKVYAPPASDSLYAYVLRTPRGLNTIYHDAGHQSRITLPVVPTPSLGAEPKCGAMEAVRCIAKPNG